MPASPCELLTRCCRCWLPADQANSRALLKRQAQFPKLKEIGGHIVGAGADVGLRTGWRRARRLHRRPSRRVCRLVVRRQHSSWRSGRTRFALAGKVCSSAPKSRSPVALLACRRRNKFFDAIANPEGPNAFPSFGQVAPMKPASASKKGSGRFRSISGVGAARDAAEQGTEPTIDTGTGIVGDRPAGAGPVDQTRTAQNIIDLSRKAKSNQQSALSAREQAIEDAIDATEAGERTPSSPLVDTVSQIANPEPGQGSRPMQPRVKDLYETAEPYQQTRTILTSPWSDLKILSQDLGQRTNPPTRSKGRPTIGGTGPTETPCAAGRRWRAKGRSLTRRPPTTRRQEGEPALA